MNRGLYPAPDEEPPVSVSQTAASLPRADAPKVRATARARFERPIEFMAPHAGLITLPAWEWIITADLDEPDASKAVELIKEMVVAAIVPRILWIMDAPPPPASAWNEWRENRIHFGPVMMRHTAEYIAAKCAKVEIEWE